MFSKNRKAVRLPEGASAALFALVLSACAGTQAQRHDRLYATWQGSSPAPSAPEPAGRVRPIDGSKELERAAFVKAVLGRNPSLRSARQAWRAALARDSQERGLDDPMLEYSFAPFSIAPSDVPYGQTITLSQKLPWPGKRALAGEVALAEAEAAEEDFEATRLRLALMASLLFDQYYAVERSLELNEQHRTLVHEIQVAARAQYQTGRASQHEPLEAEVELARVDHQRILLSSRRAVVVAQMNGLLHRAPEAELPPPPPTLDFPDLSPRPTAELQKEALSQRPELRAQRAKIKGSEAARDLADREFYPDFGVMASYSSMWAMSEHQWMVGLSLNLPLWQGTRRGAVDEAEARIAQAKAELESASDEVRVDVESARQRLIEAGSVVTLYRDRLLPAARAQIEAARSGYVTGQTSFQALMASERSLRNEELNYQQALATLGERRAELVRALGRIPGLTRKEGAP